MLDIKDFLEHRERIGVVGLGYVGLPLAVALGSKFSVLGFDISKKRIEELKKGIDSTKELETEKIKSATIEFTSDPKEISKCKLIIVAVPTPIDLSKKPDLRYVISATELVGNNMRKGSIVVYESTVYPGLTEDVCIPILEKNSGFKNPQDFKVGYSPERINPGDKVHTFENIVKVVSSQDKDTTRFLGGIYGRVVKAGIHMAPSIKVAEAAKVIENTQRDLNIALMNELAMIFHKMGIDTLDVIKAASTKWNFLPFTPGLVGGHCIGVDPYYLTYKAETLNHHPEVILAGRRINDQMGFYVAHEIIKKLIKLKNNINGCKVGIFGLTFKENIPDIRNTKVIDLISELNSFYIKTIVHDPMADKDEVMEKLGIEMVDFESIQGLDAIVLAVPHRFYLDMPLDNLLKKLRQTQGGLIADIKGVLPRESIENESISYWRL